ncbi:MAG: hypothetical protein L6V83_06650 [Christensenella sp.]|nr:MAG: hypothetical protein L6V83_06650 [Christensenella sp.]
MQYENAWHCVAQAATQAKWHNKGTILIYASAACLPRWSRKAATASSVGLDGCTRMRGVLLRSCRAGEVA